jgi:hypothetical protein
MLEKTLYFTTGVTLPWSGTVTNIECERDTMVDEYRFWWPAKSILRLRRLVHQLQQQFPLRPMFQANKAGTEALITHLQPLVDLQNKEAAQYFLGSIVLHQLGYEPSLYMKFSWRLHS